MPEPPKLGEILCRHGMLTPEGLTQALENQVVYGGRLGTNLVELSLARIDDVARCLVVQRGFPQATQELISSITPEITALIPKEICTKYELCPLGRDQSAVHVALTAPTDELLARLRAFFHETPIKPYIVPEMRLHYCLEQYYGLQRPKRFLRLPDGGEQQARQRSYLAATLHVPSGTSSAPLVQSSEGQLGDQRTETGDSARLVFAPVRGTGSHQALPAQITVPQTAKQTHPELVYLDEIEDRPDPTPPDTQGREPQRAIAQVLQVMDGASTGSEIAQMLVAPLCPETAASVLFWVRGELAVGCCASGAGVDHGQVPNLVIPLDKPSVLQWSIALGGVVRASGQDDPTQQKIADFLGTEPPDEVCIMPVTLKGKVVNLVAIHSRPGQGLPETLVADLRALAERAQTAYQRLMTQAKR